MDFNQIAGSLGVPVAVMAAMGCFLWALWRFVTGPLMDKILAPLATRHITFLDGLENRSVEADARRAAEHMQVLTILKAIAVKLGLADKGE